MTSDTDSENSGKQPTVGEIKRRVRSMYLGKYGIHGVGARSADQIIRIYISQDVPQQQEGIEKIRKEIAPWQLDVVFEDRAIIQTDPLRPEVSDERSDS
jgi:hypothetical protein